MAGYSSAEADAVHRDPVAPVHELLAEGPKLLGELAEGESRLQQRLVVLDVGVGVGVDAPLLVARRCVAHP